MIVFVRTGRLLHAALMPMFDDIAGAERFGRLLKCDEDTFVASVVQFKNDQVRKRGRESLFGLAASNPEQKTRLQREVDTTDRQIDQLVYELYQLTEEEIKIVEEESTK